MLILVKVKMKYNILHCADNEAEAKLSILAQKLRKLNIDPDSL
jgi:hypothetical protein